MIWTKQKHVKVKKLLKNPMKYLDKTVPVNLTYIGYFSSVPELAYPYNFLGKDESKTSIGVYFPNAVNLPRPGMREAVFKKGYITNTLTKQMEGEVYYLVIYEKACC